MMQILAKIKENRFSSGSHTRDGDHPNIELKSRNNFDFRTLQVLTGEEKPLLASKDSNSEPRLVSPSEGTDKIEGTLEEGYFTYGSRYFHECPKIIITSDSCDQCDENVTTSLGDKCHSERYLGNLNLRRNSQTTDDLLRRIVIPTTPEMAGGRKTIQEQRATSNTQEKQKQLLPLPQDIIDTVLRDKHRDRIHQPMVSKMKSSQESEESLAASNFGGLSIGEFHSPKFIPKRKYSKKKKTKTRLYDNNLMREHTLTSIVETDEEEMTSSSSSEGTASLKVEKEEPESLVDDLDDPFFRIPSSEQQNDTSAHEDNIRNTLIHKVVGNGDLTMLESLIKQGCTDLNQVDHQGWPPLLEAVKKGSILCAKLLLKNRAKINFVHKSTGNCLLHKLVEEGYYEAVEFLLQQGANPNVLNHQGWPPLHTALRAHQFKCAALLIRSGTDVTYYTHKRIEEYCRVIEMSKGFQQHWQLEI